MNSQTEFINKEVAKILELTPRTVQFYTDEGLIIPEKANPVGRGTTRKYSKKNLVEFLIVKELSKNGVALKRIKRIMEWAQKQDVYQKWFNPDEGWMKVAKTYLIIYNPSSVHKEKIAMSWVVNPDKAKLEGLTEEQIRIRKMKKYKIEVDMKDQSTALVIDITELAKRIINI